MLVRLTSLPISSTEVAPEEQHSTNVISPRSQVSAFKRQRSEVNQDNDEGHEPIINVKRVKISESQLEEDIDNTLLETCSDLKEAQEHLKMNDSTFLMLLHWYQAGDMKTFLDKHKPGNLDLSKLEATYQMLNLNQDNINDIIQALEATQVSSTSSSSESVPVQQQQRTLYMTCPFEAEVDDKLMNGISAFTKNGPLDLLGSASGQLFVFFGQISKQIKLGEEPSEIAFNNEDQLAALKEQWEIDSKVVPFYFAKYKDLEEKRNQPLTMQDYQAICDSNPSENPEVIKSNLIQWLAYRTLEKQLFSQTPHYLKNLPEKRSAIIVAGHGGPGLNYIVGEDWSSQYTGEQLAAKFEEYELPNDINFHFVVCNGAIGKPLGSLDPKQVQDVLKNGTPPWALSFLLFRKEKYNARVTAEVGKPDARNPGQTVGKEIHNNPILTRKFSQAEYDDYWEKSVHMVEVLQNLGVIKPDLSDTDFNHALNWLSAEDVEFPIINRLTPAVSAPGGYIAIDDQNTGNSI